MDIFGFSASSDRDSRRRGFTLLEMAVSVSIIAILSGIMIGYSRETGRRLALITVQSKFINLIGHAKSVSQSFVLNPPAGKLTCAYGVHVDKVNERVFIFQDLVSDTAECDASDNKFTTGEELAGEVNNIYLDTDFDIDADTNLTDIVFIPPDPQVIINASALTTSAKLIINLHENADEKFTIEVNSFGQIRLL